MSSRAAVPSSFGDLAKGVLGLKAPPKSSRSLRRGRWWAGLTPVHCHPGNCGWSAIEERRPLRRLPSLVCALP
jgi:hypothetical protein